MQRHEANRAALRARQQELTPLVTRLVAAQSGMVPWACEGDIDHAMGVSLIFNGRVLAVICPVASRITAEIAARLSSMTVYVASDKEQRAIARRCRAGQRIVIVCDPSI